MAILYAYISCISSWIFQNCILFFRLIPLNVCVSRNYLQSWLYNWSDLTTTGKGSVLLTLHTRWMLLFFFLKRHLVDVESVFIFLFPYWLVILVELCFICIKWYVLKVYKISSQFFRLHLNYKHVYYYYLNSQIKCSKKRII